MTMSNGKNKLTDDQCCNNVESLFKEYIALLKIKVNTPLINQPIPPIRKMFRELDKASATLDKVLNKIDLYWPGALVSFTSLYFEVKYTPRDKGKTNATETLIVYVF